MRGGGSDLPDEEKAVSATEVRKTVASSLGAAFGFVIGLLCYGAKSSSAGSRSGEST